MCIILRNKTHCATCGRVRNKTFASVIYFARLRLAIYFKAYHARRVILLFVLTVNKVGRGYPNRYDREESCETSVGTNRFAIISRWKAQSIAFAASRATFLLSGPLIAGEADADTELKG